ncbi:hypothetical protein CTheo_4107 [Ceratobasidium theobromae]|uniref:BRCT domain-containing protein n=1 Tax=Ceratobasidium theobromae TaxID=1582974 RepID=A0A5N5QL46_9AGAM|nr:hypothetical protein CTheo_4107 [Ceratobasidium theobromae]
MPMSWHESAMALPAMPFPVFKPRRTLELTDVFVDHFGAALPVFVHKDVAGRDALAQLVTQHGGELAPTMRHAVYLIVDPHTSDGQDAIDGYGDRPDKRVLRPEWIHLCAAQGRLAIAGDWAGCRLGRSPPRKRPADDPPDTAPKQPRTDPYYPYVVPAYYPPYPYYDPPAPPPPKKRNPRPPRQPNRPWTLEENIALYTFMTQHPAPTEREQATLVRRWAKETRPDRGRQSWVAHAFATSFKNWVKEYEAGNITANPADFAAPADADADAEADPDHDHDHDHDPDHDASPEFQPAPSTDFQAPQFPPQPQFGQPGPSYPPGHPHAQYVPPNGFPPAQFTPQPQYTPPTSVAPLQFPPNPTSPPDPPFSQFNEPQQQPDPDPNPVQETEPRSDESADVQAQPQASTPTATAPAGTAPGSTAPAGFPPIYPIVYPPAPSVSDAEPGKDTTA